MLQFSVMVVRGEEVQMVWLLLRGNMNEYSDQQRWRMEIDLIVTILLPIW